MLRAVSFVSLVYDVTVGLALLLAADRVASTFGVPPASPAVLADTNGLFLIAVGLGYVLPFRDPVTWRAYLWLMGPFLKGLGAAAFIRDVVVRGAPQGFLLFAVSDGTLAVLTLLALWRERPPRRDASGPAA